MEKEAIGLLFGTIPYYSQEHVNSVIDELTKEQATFFVSQALHHSFSQGVFNLLESELISKSIRKLSEK